MSTMTPALVGAWQAAEVLGWDVVAIVRHRSAPLSKRWNAQISRHGRRVIGFGPTPDAALDAALERIR